jgi:peptidoglycan-associated lipoprotein
MKKSLIPIIIALFFLSSCINKQYKNGVKNYNWFAYSKAIKNFEKYLSKKNEPFDAKVMLANSYRHENDMINAERWYSKIIDSSNIEPIEYFHYAKILMELERYNEAKIWLEKYLKTTPDDFVAEVLLVSCQSVKTFKTDTTLFSVEKANIPEVSDAFGQVPYGSGIIFTADKVTFSNSKTDSWTGKSYLDLYFTQKDANGKWLSPSILKGTINGQYHEGPACFNKKGDVVYFTRSNYLKRKKLGENSKHENNLMLFRAELVGDHWTNVTELPFDNNEYSCGHPTLSSDEKTLFFISDMPGGMGGTDIYKIEINGNTYGKPENLGSEINTSGNEMFPYMHSDGTLYFSSDAHENMGGLDVFMSYYDGRKWLQVENLNYPLNTSKDDFAFVLKDDNKTGYLSSNRGDDGDKIYEVIKHDPTFILSGTVFHKGKPTTAIESAVIEIENITEKSKETILTNKFGAYKLKLKTKCEYKIKASKAMHFTITAPQYFCMIGKKTSENFTANFELDEIIIEKPIVLENIYYDLDKWLIREDAAVELNRLVQVMQDNPSLNIELSSHTDSRAGDQYNLVLSDKRAKAAVEYIISKGIDAKRMKWKVYGESLLINQCKNDVICSEEEHQKNRRTEFKAIKIGK